MPEIVVVAQRKGGAGKTTFSVSLAAVGVSRAFQIGTVDLDSQANLSLWALGTSTVRGLSREQTAAMLEYPVRRDWLNLAHPLRGENVTRDDVIEYVKTECVHASESVPGLDVLPLAPGVHCEDAGELLLRGLPHDYLVVDTPADTSIPATRAALSVADYVVVPVLPDSFSIWATELLIREIAAVGRADLLESNRVRLVINQRQKWAVHDAAETEIRERYGSLVVADCVARAVRITEASMAPELLKKTNPVFKAAERLWDEIAPQQKRKGRAA